MNDDKKDNKNVLEAIDNLVEFLDIEPDEKGKKLVGENGEEYEYIGSKYYLWDFRKNDEDEFISEQNDYPRKDHPDITPKKLVDMDPLDYPHVFEKVLLFEGEKHMIEITVELNQNGWKRKNQRSKKYFEVF